MPRLKTSKTKLFYTALVPSPRRSGKGCGISCSTSNKARSTKLDLIAASQPRPPLRLTRKHGAAPRTAALRRGILPRAAGRCRKGLLRIVDRRTLNHVAESVDDEAKPPVLREERQTMPALVFGDPTLIPRGNLPVAQMFLNDRRNDPETVRNGLGVNLDGTFLKFNCSHLKRPLPFSYQYEPIVMMVKGGACTSPPRTAQIHLGPLR